MITQSEVISYLDMCRVEGVSLQRGMNYHLNGTTSVILMSRRPNAPYEDSFEEDGRTLIYEGHDEPRISGGSDPKTVDQPMCSPSGRLTQNGRFFRAARDTSGGGSQPERVRVYEKLRPGIWVFNGTFVLIDAWQEASTGRHVFKFKLVLVDEVEESSMRESSPDRSRLIPSPVKLEVWKRDGGRCVKCGATDHLHFDHVIPYSRGGASIVAENIQLLCARHNLEKRDRIE